ncbi:hypothetical protein [Dyadobacter sp. 676]|uniref:DUF2029 domain-containing protein n=1 Tax=Dyadobacter sp. 676 TaxID=3088362 RepID=A0AAU8FRX7_9BACT
MPEFKVSGWLPASGNTTLRKRLFPPRFMYLLIVFYLVLEGYYLIFRFNAHIQDLTLYRDTAVKMLGGQVPFRDFKLEYPLLSLLPILIPGILSNLADGSFHSYVAWFMAQNLLLGLLMARIIGKMDPAGKALPRYMAALLLSLPVFLFRFDSFPALLTILAIGYAMRRPFLSGMSWATATAAKLYPIVLIPVFGLYYLSEKSWYKLARQAGGCVVITGVVAGFSVLAGMGGVSDFMHYHMLRGIQVESVAGGVMLLLESTGIVKLDIAHSFGAMHLVTPLAASVLQVIDVVIPACFLAMLAYVAWAFRAGTRAGRAARLIPAAAAQILLFILLNKVLSPQYLIWLLPLISFCRLRTYLIFGAALMLTIVIFPGHYYNLISKQLTMIALLNIRNALLIWLFIALIREINPMHTSRRV